jgi:hypothetical protein
MWYEVCTSWTDMNYRRSWTDGVFWSVLSLLVVRFGPSWNLVGPLMIGRSGDLKKWGTRDVVSKVVTRSLPSFRSSSSRPSANLLRWFCP